MDRELERIKKIINDARIKGETPLIVNREYLQRLVNYVDTLHRDNKKMRKLCDKYEEEHNTTFVKWHKDIMRKHKAVNYIKTNELVDVDILLDILEGEDEE